MDLCDNNKKDYSTQAFSLGVFSFLTCVIVSFSINQKKQKKKLWLGMETYGHVNLKQSLSCSCRFVLQKLIWTLDIRGPYISFIHRRRITQLLTQL